jgi:DNA-directed RNA polymerase specialized sigma24 family protein
MNSDKDLENSMRFFLSKLSPDELRLAKELAEKLLEEKEADLSVPVEVFSQGLNVVESLTKYLKEDKKKSFADIAKLLNKKENTVWLNYERAHSKMAERLIIPAKPAIIIPISALVSDNHNLLESIVIYLRDAKGLSNKEVASMLKTSEVVTSAAYHRTRKK